MNISLRTFLIRSIALLTILNIWLLTALPALAMHEVHITIQPQTWNVGVGVQLRESSTEGMVYGPKEIWINVGDTVKWYATSDLEHTVTFLKPGQKEQTFNRHSQLVTHQQGGSHYDGHSYYNSGLMSNFPPGHEQDTTNYSLIFDVAGDFTFSSLLQPAMTGIIHVRRAGTPYPFTSKDYYQQRLKIVNEVRAAGARLATAARKYSNNHSVILGVGDGTTSVFTFTPSLITIHAGEAVLFQQADGLVPHTVTFGSSTLSNEVAYGNSAAFDGTTAFNSGWLCMAPTCAKSSYRVTFTRPGTFVLHDDLNKYTMLMTVIVLK